METVGIDLSAEPKGTAIAVVAWADSVARVLSVQTGASDDLVLRYLHHPDGAVGVDCPLGWPALFVRLIAGHHGGSLDFPPDRPKGWRREYVLRATDMFVHQHTGITPLSVAADRIGHTAIRLAALLSELGSQIDARRDGSGSIVEVYPAAALKLWGFRSRGYKGAANGRQLGALVDEVQRAIPWLDWGDSEAVCRRNDDALDAVVCALIARAAKAGATIPPRDTELALCEGWIHLPNGDLPSTPWS